METTPRRPPPTITGRSRSAGVVPLLDRGIEGVGVEVGDGQCAEFGVGERRGGCGRTGSGPDRRRAGQAVAAEGRDSGHASTIAERDRAGSGDLGEDGAGGGGGVGGGDDRAGDDDVVGAGGERGGGGGDALLVAGGGCPRGGRRG